MICSISIAISFDFETRDKRNHCFAIGILYEMQNWIDGNEFILVLKNILTNFKKYFKI